MKRLLCLFLLSGAFGVIQGVDLNFANQSFEKMKQGLIAHPEEQLSTYIRGAEFEDNLNRINDMYIAAWEGGEAHTGSKDNVFLVEKYLSDFFLMDYNQLLKNDLIKKQNMVEELLINFQTDFKGDIGKKQEYLKYLKNKLTNPQVAVAEPVSIKAKKGYTDPSKNTGLTLQEIINLMKAQLKETGLVSKKGFVGSKAIKLFNLKNKDDMNSIITFNNQLMSIKDGEPSTMLDELIVDMNKTAPSSANNQFKAEIYSAVQQDKIVPNDVWRKYLDSLSEAAEEVGVAESKADPVYEAVAALPEPVLLPSSASINFYNLVEIENELITKEIKTYENILNIKFKEKQELARSSK